ncbi:MAG: Gfo/Idh/MocA family oxidoreductase [Planctomycetales bacterium]|nr:Gfo/Idh/MocA family oxidoreductase [Planctomycetales bacterium]
MSTAPIRIMLAGVGPHARRFYLPTLSSLAKDEPISVVGAVELQGAENQARSALEQHGFSGSVLGVPRFEETLPPEVEQQLDDWVNEHRPRVLIVATDPLSHKPYVLWGLKHHLEILLDKPITTRRDAVSSLDAANGIEADFEEILLALQEARRTIPINISVCAHRRFHPGFDEILRLIREVCGHTGCPVSDVHAHHADGQWRLPEEIRTQDHQSYHAGNGKASHSGHHFFDMIHRILDTGSASGVVWDTAKT